MSNPIVSEDIDQTSKEDEGAFVTFFTPEERKERLRKQQKAWYIRNREKRLAQVKNYQRRKKEERDLLEQQSNNLTCQVSNDQQIFIVESVKEQTITLTGTIINIIE